MKCDNCPCEAKKCIFEGNKRVCSGMPDSPYYKLAKDECERGILKQVSSAFTAAANYVTGHVSSEEMTKARLSICDSCDLLDQNRRCEGCGCFVDLKVQVSSEECPAGKWGRAEIETPKSTCCGGGS